MTGMLHLLKDLMLTWALEPKARIVIATEKHSEITDTQHIEYSDKRQVKGVSHKGENPSKRLISHLSFRIDESHFGGL